MLSFYRLPQSASTSQTWILLLIVAWWTTVGVCMTDNECESLRRETIGVFYHGYDNYMTHAFPEDELKPISCSPLTRDRHNPAYTELNDVLGNYSLTLIDSLSTLAILASSPSLESSNKNPLEDFQNGVASLVNLYGDGTDGPSGHGMRSKGFDLDSKVQVFETVIRGVGGLLSAHLFATGDLPIKGYAPRKGSRQGDAGIPWPNSFTYNGQLLKLALDLGKRLLPAFHTSTDLPYPRVNLRYGVPFYPNSPLNYDAEHGQCGSHPSSSPEITETCSAGAGSLVLEFTVLSRLTGDSRFEDVAKKAFWAVWKRRSAVGLIGAGVDAETGNWVSPFTGIGAGVDSFFEYAFKSHILLSGSSEGLSHDAIKHELYFLSVWQDAHASIKRHLYRGSAYQSPHYVQGDLHTGATRAFWVDSLSAYYPGLLTLAGEVDEAVETHLLYAALWTRYSALPERWSTASGNIDSELRWWGGRPEFIESTWYLYRATQDPWYLHVGEMALCDIKRRCWTQCGWAGLEDVRSGELKDRMESFFLGETIKYLYLLFDPNHPLNKLDAPFVFTTEGHPLIIPRAVRNSQLPHTGLLYHLDPSDSSQMLTCPSPPARMPFTISAVTARHDFFHAASLARLHRMPSPGDTAPLVEYTYGHPSFSEMPLASPNNYTYYPWTLPAMYIPSNGTSSKLEIRITFDLSFPVVTNVAAGPLALQRVPDGFVVNSLSGLKLSMVQERDGLEDIYRIYSVSGLTLGRDEKLYVKTEVVATLNPVDPYFTRHRDSSILDVVIDTTLDQSEEQQSEILPDPILVDGVNGNLSNHNRGLADLIVNLPKNVSFINALKQHFSAALEQQASLSAYLQGEHVVYTAAVKTRPHLVGTVATGIGAESVPDVADTSLTGSAPLTWTTIFASDATCHSVLPISVPKEHQIIIMKRGECTFSQKLRNIPSFAATKNALQLVIVVSYPDNDPPGSTMRPLLDEVQYTSTGMPRFNAVPLLMVEGGNEAYEMLRHARGIGLRRRYHFSSQGLRIANLYVV